LIRLSDALVGMSIGGQVLGPPGPR
jgi:hypothetical protein